MNQTTEQTNPWQFVSAGLFNMQGYELIDHGHIMPLGKIFFGGVIMIDNENGSFTVIDQDKNQSVNIIASSPRSFIMKWHKMGGQRSSADRIINRTRYSNEVIKRNEALNRGEC